MPTRLYYVTYQGNSFDTHVQQADLHSRLLMYTADAVRGFMEDIKRIGRGDDVAVMMFTEFGRRVEENGSLGTDHGTATPMFIVGKGVKGGFYGRHPSLTDLDDGNMKMTTDFRRVYATVIKEWLGYDETHGDPEGTASIRWACSCRSSGFSRTRNGRSCAAHRRGRVDVPRGAAGAAATLGSCLTGLRLLQDQRPADLPGEAAGSRALHRLPQGGTPLRLHADGGGQRHLERGRLAEELRGGQKVAVRPATRRACCSCTCSRRQAGGDFYHSGGKHWSSQDDPEWQILRAWVMGQTK